MAANNINAIKFEELIHSEKPVLVDFWAPWCGYCRRIGPAYDLIAQQYGGEVNVVKVNIDEEPKLAEVAQGQLIRCHYPEKEVRTSEEHKHALVDHES